MNKKDFDKIVEYCKKLCKKNVPNHPSGVSARNQNIVGTLCRKFSINSQLAWEIFTNNNDYESLENIYKKYFGD